jgi:hypothetical protein
VATSPSPGTGPAARGGAGEAGAPGAPGAEPSGAEPQVTADDLRAMVRALGLVEIPEHLMPKVLEEVRSHRAAMRRFDEAGIDLADVVTAQPFRA